MTDQPNSSKPGDAAAFNRMYFLILAGLVVLVLGLYLFFASTRQPRGNVTGPASQKGMVALSGRATAV